MKTTAGIILIASMLLAGCSSPQAAATQRPGAPGTPTPLPEIQIVFTKSGGFAGVEESLSISSEGRITTSDGKTGQVSNAELSKAVEELEKLGFFELKGSYNPLDTCCDRFTYQLEVTVDGKPHTVTALQGAPETPDEFWQALEIVNTLLADVK